MRCHKPDTDQTAYVQVFADGHLCPEYILPEGVTSSSDPNTLRCFVPVSEGDPITIKGEFQGTVLHGSIDLLADGSFLGDRRIEGLKTGEAKVVRRKFDFQKVFDMPTPANYRSIYPSTLVVEGELRVKKFDDQPQFHAGDTYGVGSLVVIMSVNQTCDDNYDSNYDSTVCGAWWSKDVEKMDHGGIVPTQELVVDITDDQIHLNRQSKHRRHATQTRFGAKPWATFVFYYRTLAGIKNAGCILRPVKSHQLESVKETSEYTDAVSQQGDRMDNLKNADRKMGSSMFMTPPPPPLLPGEKKQKLFGQSLKLSRSSFLRGNEVAASTHASTPAPIFSEDSPSPTERRSNDSQVQVSIEYDGEVEATANRTFPQGTRAHSGTAGVIVPAYRATEVKVKQEPAEDEHAFDFMGGGVLNSASTASSTSPATPTTLTGSKRSIASLTTSREGTPSGKKLRMSNRKVSLLARLEEKRLRNQVAKEALAEQKKLREEEERRQEEEESVENAELERMIAAEDDEFENLEKATKMEKDAYDELMIDGNE